MTELSPVSKFVQFVSYYIWHDKIVCGKISKQVYRSQILLKAMQYTHPTRLISLKKTEIDKKLSRSAPS
jgi:hypothetical protein